MAQKFHTFQQAVSYLNTFIRPVDFERVQVGKKSFINPLERMKYFLSLLHNPQNSYPSIVVSGTSGKGSTTYMIAQMLCHAGYKTGMTVSPHIMSVTERLQINGMQISEAYFLSLLQEILPVIATVTSSSFGQPSYFEILLAMVFLYFSREKVDIAVVEVGLEGKYDGTNVLDPLMFVVTNLSLDHTAILGDSVIKIAYEATDRIKKSQKYLSPAMTVISGIKQQSVLRILEKKCRLSGAALVLSTKDFTYKILSQSQGKMELIVFQEGVQDIPVTVPLMGRYQAENTSIAITAVCHLQQYGFHISVARLYKAFTHLVIPGRFEQLIEKQRDKLKKYTLILDGAHNPAKMHAFIQTATKQYKNCFKIFIVALTQGHQMDRMLSLIGRTADVIILTQNDVPTDMGFNRSVTMMQMKEYLQELIKKNKKNIQIYTVENPVKTLQIAEELLAVKKENPQQAVVLITGSLYLVGTLRRYLLAVHREGQIV